MTIIAGLLYRVSPYSDYNWCLGQHCFWLFRQGTAGRLTLRTMASNGEGDETSIDTNKHRGNSIENIVTI